VPPPTCPHTAAPAPPLPAPRCACAGRGRHRVHRRHAGPQRLPVRATLPIRGAVRSAWLAAARRRAPHARPRARGGTRRTRAARPRRAAWGPRIHGPALGRGRRGVCAHAPHLPPLLHGLLREPRGVAGAAQRLHALRGRELYGGVRGGHRGPARVQPAHGCRGRRGGHDRLRGDGGGERAGCGGESESENESDTHAPLPLPLFSPHRQMAFEQGRLLPTPEQVRRPPAVSPSPPCVCPLPPCTQVFFRLTRDVVAGFGPAGVGGAFLGGCEATLQRAARAGALAHDAALAAAARPALPLGPGRGAAEAGAGGEGRHGGGGGARRRCCCPRTGRRQQQQQPRGGARRQQERGRRSPAPQLLAAGLVGCAAGARRGQAPSSRLRSWPGRGPQQQQQQGARALLLPPGLGSPPPLGRRRAAAALRRQQRTLTRMRSGPCTGVQTKLRGLGLSPDSAPSPSRCRSSASSRSTRRSATSAGCSRAGSATCEAPGRI